MGKLYDILKASKLGAGAATDFYTALIGQSLSKSSAQEHEITDVPPIIFNTNQGYLGDWAIYGNSGGVGSKTANLFDKNNYELTGYYGTSAGYINSDPSNVRSFVLPCEPNTSYCFTKMLSNRFAIFTSISPPTVGGTFNLKFADATQTSLVFTTGQSDHYIIVMFSYGADTPTTQDVADSVMLSKNSVPVPYEKYGYKIPVICGGQTTNIYIDSPLSTGESISKAETGVDIPTIDGSNTLSIDTPVQPSQMYIKYYK